jgi:hypothetical protein
VAFNTAHLRTAGTFVAWLTMVRSAGFEDGRCADFKNGATVEVRGTRQGDGSVAATKVERD